MKTNAFNPESLIIVSEHFYPSTGATAQLIKNLADHLHHSGIPLVILTSSKGPALTPYPVYRFLSKSSTSSSIVVKLANGISFLAGTLKWLLIHSRSTNTLFIASNPPFIGVLGLITKYMRRSRYLFLLQDLFPRSATLTGIVPSKGPVPFFWKTLIQLILKNSSSTIVLSEAMQRRCRDEYGILPNLITIHNWPVFPDPGAINTRSSDLPSISKLVVQYSGNFGRLHDILTLLEAARLVQDEPIYFVFIGAGAKYKQISRYKDELGLSNIEVHPYVPIEELSNSIASCDISVISLIPGAADTVAPSKLYGILACSRPVLLIASDDCELARLVRNSGAGFVFHSGDSIAIADLLRSLLHNNSRLVQSGTNAYSLFSNRFRSESALSQYYSLIQKTRL